MIVVLPKKRPRYDDNSAAVMVGIVSASLVLGLGLMFAIAFNKASKGKVDAPQVKIEETTNDCTLQILPKLIIKQLPSHCSQK